jgi:RND family efflux transporter MFP subunit
MALDQDALKALRGERGTAVHGTARTRSRNWWYVSGALLLLVAAYVIFGHAPLKVSTVTAVALPANAPAAAVLDASGFVVARRQATVSAKVTGKVVAINIEEGMAVKAGQVLARLDDSQATLQYALAQRQIEAATGSLQQVQARLADAQRTFARNEKLIADKLVSQAALDAAQTEVMALTADRAAAEGNLAVARSTLKLRAQDLEDLVIRAPFAGVVISKDAQPGEMISPISAGGGFTRTGIATVVDMDSREIEVDVNEAFINRVHDGQKTEATLDAYPDWHIPSHVLNVVPTADRQKATVRVRISFDSLDPRILTDMGVKVRFIGDAPAAGAVASKDIVLVPADALVNDGGKDYVWTISDGLAHRVPVTLGNAREGNMEISVGVAAGATLIAPPVAGLTEGARVSAAPPKS